MSGASDFDFRVEHVGINCGSPEEAAAAGAFFGTLFGIAPTRDTAFSVYAGPALELMKSPGRGTHGHISISTSDLDGAMAWLASRGILFDRNSIKRTQEGAIQVIYLSSEVAGFAVHLQRR
jgi:hypothetical protein